MVSVLLVAIMLLKVMLAVVAIVGTKVNIVVNHHW